MIISEFEKVCSSFDSEKLRNNFNTLISVFSISISELSRALNYDSSYISRIRNGQRRPANPLEFTNEISRYIVRHYNTANDLAVAEKLLCNDQSQVVFQRYLERASNSIFRALATLLFAHQDESLRRSMVSALSPTV